MKTTRYVIKALNGIRPKPYYAPVADDRCSDWSDDIKAARPYMLSNRAHHAAFLMGLEPEDYELVSVGVDA